MVAARYLGSICILSAKRKRIRSFASLPDSRLAVDAAMAHLKGGGC